MLLSRPMKLKELYPNILAFIAGALLTLSFAPFSLFPIALFSIAGLLWLWLDVTPKRAFQRGWLFGFGLFSTGVYWIFISINTYGTTSLFLSLLITTALIAILALFPAVTGYVLNRYFPYSNDTKILCAFPALWVLFEWIRSWIFTGFPWLSLGYSQMNSPLRGYAPVLGFYGVTLMTLLTSGLFISALLKLKQTRYKQAGYALASVFMIWIVGIILSQTSWTHLSTKPIKVSLIQGNIAQHLKWSSDQIEPTLALYEKLTKKHWDSQIIVWPESAVPISMLEVTDFLENIRIEAARHHSTVILGVPIYDPAKDGFYNAVIALGTGTGIYTKHRLVPFGEFIPLKRYLGRLFDLLQVPMSDFIPGVKLPKPIEVDGIKIATFVCYEIAFPEQVLSRDGTIDMILTVSNDAWFGHSIAQAQHLEIARMRALEMGRPILFVSNDGITAVINTWGKIQAVVPQYQTDVLTAEVFTAKGKTPWQRLGADPIFIILIVLLFIAIRKHKS